MPPFSTATKSRVRSDSRVNPAPVPASRAVSVLRPSTFLSVPLATLRFATVSLPAELSRVPVTTTVPSVASTVPRLFRSPTVSEAVSPLRETVPSETVRFLAVVRRLSRFRAAFLSFVPDTYTSLSLTPVTGVEPEVSAATFTVPAIVNLSAPPARSLSPSAFKLTVRLLAMSMLRSAASGATYSEPLSRTMDRLP